MLEQSDLSSTVVYSNTNYRVITKTAERDTNLCTSSRINNPSRFLIRIRSKQLLTLDISMSATTIPAQCSPLFVAPLLILRLHLKVRSVNVRGTGVAASKNRGNGKCRGGLGCEAGSGTRSAGAGVSVLLESNISGVGCAGAPLRPSGSVDDIGHAGLLDGDTSILLPGTAEVESAAGNGLARAGGNVAVVEDIPAAAVAVAAGSSNVAESGGHETDVTVREPGRGRLTEDEVSCADNLALGVELVTSLGEDGVLETAELAAVVTLVLYMVSLVVFVPDK